MNCNINCRATQLSISNSIATVIVLLLIRSNIACAFTRGKLLVPDMYVAGSGDLHIQLHILSVIEPTTTTSSTNTTVSQTTLHQLRLQITKIEDEFRQTAINLNIYPDVRSNVTQIQVSCQHFLYAGLYELEVVDNNLYAGLVNGKDERLRQRLDVIWPMPKLSVIPETVHTYPQVPVDIVLEFSEIECSIELNENVPEFWLEVFYCGRDAYCDIGNGSNAQIIYSEQVRGYPKKRSIKLRCELIGLAGIYVVKLRPTVANANKISATAFIKADWSDQYVFNVHARSIEPCDPHTGIGVLFEYPSCILDRADRVRLFAKLRADVASLAPPTSLHYVTEKRVTRGQHSLYFDCELFSEKYVEYCFVYVSQAVSGAVADIRMDCLPTLEVSDTDAGGWGSWSDWTPCSTTCAGGTKNRYRVCDAPPPRYGAKFCKGDAVETIECGSPVSGTWECMYGIGNAYTGLLPADRPEVKVEIGPGCRCGCIVHLSVSKPRRLIASSAESCPGRSFWLIQADDGNLIHVSLDFFRLICMKQYLRIRDGDSLASNLIAEYVGGMNNLSKTIISSDTQILLEFFSNELSTANDACKGGFLLHAQQALDDHPSNGITLTRKAVMPPEVLPLAIKLTFVHVTAVLFASIIIVVSALLGAQYIFRYRKYQLTEGLDETDSPTHTPRASLGSIPIGQMTSRASSTSTLLSEVAFLVKLRPRHTPSVKHSRLRESVESAIIESLKTDLQNNPITKSEDDDTSSHTLNNETMNVSPVTSESKDYKTASSNDVLSESTSPISSAYSPPRTNSVSLPHTPDLSRMWNKGTLKKVENEKAETKSVNGRTRHAVKPSDVITVCEDGYSDCDEDISIKRIKRMKKLNGCYSPASSLASTATIRTTNIKESKEKRNREKLLAGPGSEFSLANPEDFELDYYDYNVINAGAAPGSYLGMDPAYLVWIPPLDGGDIIQEIDDESEPFYEEIQPKPEIQLKIEDNTNKNGENTIVDKSNSLHTATEKDEKNSKIIRMIVDEEGGDTAEDTAPGRSFLGHHFKNIPVSDDIQMKEMLRSSPIRIHRTDRKTSSFSSHQEKETAEVKREFYEVDDIQFADDEEDAAQNCDRLGIENNHKDTNKRINLLQR